MAPDEGPVDVELFLAISLAPLRAIGELPQALMKACRSALVETLDSHATATWCAPASTRSSSAPAVIDHALADLPALASTLAQQVRKVGLGPVFGPFFRAVEPIVVNALLDGGSRQRAARVSQAGGRLAFMLSDQGGGPLATWRTVLAADRKVLTVAKRAVWSDHATVGAVVAARGRNGLVPTGLLLDGAALRALRHVRLGAPFLGGAFWLDDVSGTLASDQFEAVDATSPIAFANCLAAVRPAFAVLVLAHAQHLLRASEPSAAAAWIDVADALADVAERLLHSGARGQRPGLALKFAVNSLLHQLVSEVVIQRGDHQRDVLALAKMEGSNYTCLQALMH